MPRGISLASLALLASLTVPHPRRVQGAEKPALVVLIVIDQFPQFLLPRLEARFGPGGFRRLMEQGAWYTDAHYPHAATLTGVGHATIATGALSAGHGIAGNDWYDAEADRAVYCVQDPTHHWVGGKEKEGEGTSPLYLATTTFSDDWLLSTGLNAKAVSLSLKDRGCILLGGKLGKAVWYDERTGLFVSSTYYFPDQKLPAWLEAFNAAKPADKCFGKTWDLLLPRETYTAAADDRSYEIEVKGLGRTFPHKLGAGFPGPGPELYKALLNVPDGNQMLFDLARAAMEAEKLGRRGVTDMLLLSLTANDYCGHHFGPESLESEDIVLRTDRQLAAFLSDVDRHAGPGRALIVLTSDHGATPTSEYSAELGLRVGRIDPQAIAQAADAALDRAFGADDWSAKFFNPGLFLRSPPVRAKNADLAAVERVAAEAISRLDGVAAVFTRSDLAVGRIPPTALARAAAATFHPQRSPNVIILQGPYWYLYKDLKQYDGMHGSPYGYDTGVPVIFHGPGVAPGRYARRVSPADIAPTVAHILGMHAPASSEGRVLEEVVASPAAPAAASPSRAAAAAPPSKLELYAFPVLDPIRDASGQTVELPITLDAVGVPHSGPPRRMTLREGGFSGLASVNIGEGGANGGVELWTITDRGPNVFVEKRVDSAGKLFGSGAKYFPVPSYNQSLVRLRLYPDKTVEIAEMVGLRREGKPINGLPSSAGDRQSGETAYSSLDDASSTAVIPPSPIGYDFEGVHAARTAGGSLEFWTCDEYGPSVQIFDARGNLIRELSPGAAESGAGTPASPAISPFPRVLKHRPRNRGFEGLAGTSRHVFALVQSPFDASGGDSGEPGSGNASARIHRLVRIDKESRAVAQFAYDHLADPERYGTTHPEVKTGDLAALDDSGASFLVFEYSGKLYAHVYRITITSETTVLDGRAGVGYEAGKVPYHAVERRLIADLTGELSILPVPAKVEGLAALDQKTLLLLFDNDYGFGSDGAETFELSDLEKRSLLLKVTLPGGF